MRLVDDWRDVVLHAHSFRALALAILLMIGVETVFRVTGIDINPALVFIGLFGLLIYGAVGRLVSQRDDAGRVRSGSFWIWVGLVLAALLAANVLAGMGKVPGTPADPPAVVQVAPGLPSDADVLRIAIPHTEEFEGLRTTAYLDTLAAPPVWTICFGDTQGVQRGDTRTADQCRAGLRALLPRYGHGWYAYLTDETKARRVTVHRAAGFWDFAYNVGIAGAGRSTATRRLNAGDIAGACEAMTWWNKAGGRVWAGLVRRRGVNSRLCMVGLL